MKILLGVSGSVAAVLTAKLAGALLALGHELKIVATASSFYFLKSGNITDELEKMGIEVISETDEWPGEKYYKDQPIAHIDLGKWADIMLIAPITAQTIYKIAHGAADNLLTATVLAWDRNKRIVLAPAMNTNMWTNPLTQENLKKIKKIYKLSIAAPVAKKLACGDTGIGALAPIEDIIKAL